MAGLFVDIIEKGCRTGFDRGLFGGFHVFARWTLFLFLFLFGGIVRCRIILVLLLLLVFVIVVVGSHFFEWIQHWTLFGGWPWRSATSASP